MPIISGDLELVIAGKLRKMPKTIEERFGGLGIPVEIVHDYVISGWGQRRY